MANSLIIKTLNSIKRNPKIFTTFSSQSQIQTHLFTSIANAQEPQSEDPFSSTFTFSSDGKTHKNDTLKGQAPIPRRRHHRRPWRCRCRLTGSIMEITRTFSNLKPMNPNKTIKRIEKIEKEICGVFDLVLIFGCSGCGLCSKFMGLIFG